MDLTERIARLELLGCRLKGHVEAGGRARSGAGDPSLPIRYGHTITLPDGREASTSGQSGSEAAMAEAVTLAERELGLAQPGWVGP